MEDISEGACHKEILSTERTETPVLVSSSDNSFKSPSNEDVPLHRYKTALVGSSSFQMMSQFSRRRSPDKESDSSLEDNDFSAESLKQASVGSSSQFQPPTSRLQDDSRSLTGFEGNVDQDDTSVVASYPRNVVEGQNPVFPEGSRDLRTVTPKSLQALQPPDTTFENSKEQPIKQMTGQQSTEVMPSPFIVKEKCLADGVRKTPSSLEDISEGACHKEIMFEDRLLLEGATSVPNLLKGYKKGSSIELRSKSAPLLTVEISKILSSQVEPVGARAGGEQCFSHAGRELGSESRATFSKKRTDSSPLLEDRLPPERVKSTPTLSERSQETSTLNSPSNSASLLTEEFSQSLCSQIWPAKVIAERGQSYSHGSLGQGGFESESLSQFTIQRSQSSSTSLHDQRSQAAKSSLRKLGISVSVDSALESSPCLAERQPQNLLPHPEPAASILEKQREFSECKEDVGESSPLWSKERSDRLSLLEHRFLPEKAEASPQSLLGSLAQAGVTSLSILAPLLTKVPSERLLLRSQTARKPAEGEQKDSQGSLVLGEVENESASSGKQVFGSSFSSHDGRLSSVITKSKPSSLTDVEVKIDDGGKITETMTLPSDFVGQISGRFESEKHISRPLGKSAFSDVKTPAGKVDVGSLQSDAQSKYSIQASVGALPQRTLATSHLEGESRSAQDSLGRVNLSEMEYKSFDTSYPKHVLESQKQVFSQVSLDPRTVTPISLPALKFSNKSSSETEIKQSVGKRIVQVKSCPCIMKDYARETPSQMMGVRDDQNYEELPAKDNSVTAVNSPSLDDSFTSSSNEDVPISSYKTALIGPSSFQTPHQFFHIETSDKESTSSLTSSSNEDVPIRSYKTALSGPSSFQRPHQFFHIETSDKESTSSFEDNEFSSASEGDLHDNESCTILKTHENIHVETFPEVLKSAERLTYLKTVDSHQTVMLPAFTVEQTEDLSKLPLAETPRPSLSAPRLTVADSARPSSVISSDLSPRTDSKVPPQRSRISKVGRKFTKVFKIGKSKNRHKELQKLEPEGDSSDFDGRTEEPPTSSHWGIGHPTSHSSVSTLRDNWPFLAVAVETTESAILHSIGIAPPGQDSISSDVASSSANLYASAIETERLAPVQSSIPRDRGILTTDDAAITQRVNEMISTIVKNARAALECKLKDEISEPPCSLSDAVTTQRINEMINTIVNNARAVLKYKLKDAEMLLCEQSMKSSSESSLLGTEPYLSPNRKDSLSIITEISQGNLECTLQLQDISRRPSSETSFSPFLVENRETAGQEPPCSLLDTATTQRINEMINTIVNHARGALQYQLKENSSLEQSMKSNFESLLLATESSPSPIIKESASRAVESLPGDLECLLQLEEIPSWTDNPDTWKESEVKISPAAPENINVEEDTEKLQGAGSSAASRNSPSSEESHDDLTNISTVFRAQED